MLRFWKFPSTVLSSFWQRLPRRQGNAEGWSKYGVVGRKLFCSGGGGGVVPGIWGVMLLHCGGNSNDLGKVKLGTVCSPKRPGWLRGLPSLVLRRVPRPFFPRRIKRSGREPYHSAASSAEVKNEYTYTSHCATNQKAAGSIPDGVIGIFHWQNPSGRIMALGSTQPLTEISTRNISCGCKGGRRVRLPTLPPSCADCLEIWEPQPPEPSGPVHACNGIALPFYSHTGTSSVCLHGMHRHRHLFSFTILMARTTVRATLTPQSSISS
jgi:hypothetical protein